MLELTHTPLLGQQCAAALMRPAKQFIQWMLTACSSEGSTHDCLQRADWDLSKDDILVFHRSRTADYTRESCTLVSACSPTAIHAADAVMHSWTSPPSQPFCYGPPRASLPFMQYLVVKRSTTAYQTFVSHFYSIGVAFACCRSRGTVGKQISSLRRRWN